MKTKTKQVIGGVVFLALLAFWVIGVGHEERQNASTTIPSMDRPEPGDNLP